MNTSVSTNAGMAQPVRHADPTIAVDIHRFDLDVASARVAALAQCLSDAETRRAARFVDARDQQYWTTCRGLLRTTLAAYLGQPAHELEFAAGANGKPRVASAPGQAPLHFNLSHSGDIAVLAIAQHGPLGIDVEAARPIPDWAAVARRCFSSLEREQLRAVPGRDRPGAFYRCWTRKEAVIKATGEGLSADLHSFDVTLAADQPARMLNYRGPLADDWALLHFEPRRGYVAALAVPGAAEDELRVTHRASAGQTH